MPNYKIGSHLDINGNIIGKGAAGNFLFNFGDEQLAADPITTLFEGRKYFNTATKKTRIYRSAAWSDEGAAAAGGGDASTNTAASIDNEMVLFSGTTGKLLKRATTSGLVKLVAGVQSAAVAGTDYEAAITAGTTAQYIRGDKSLATLNAAAIPDFNTAANALITAAVTGLFDDRGNFDASVNTFPAAGGSGSAGAVLKGDVWRISVGGTLGGVVYSVGDTVRALIDAPAQVAANWAGAENNLEQATAAALGLVRLAAIAEADARTEATKALTAAALVNTPQMKEFVFGDGTASSFILTHNFNTRKLAVAFYDNVNFEEITFGLVRSAVNTITVTPAFVPTAGQFTAVITARINA